jgi:hypothetical protein
VWWEQLNGQGTGCVRAGGQLAGGWERVVECGNGYMRVRGWLCEGEGLATNWWHEGEGLVVQEREQLDIVRWWGCRAIDWP